MAIENFTSYSAPFGEAIPAGNPHAVSASLPTRGDVQRLFRDHDPEAWSQLETTYPRFGEHPFIKQALQFCPGVEGRSSVAFSSPQAAEQLLRDVASDQIVDPTILVDESMTFLSFTPGTGEANDIVTITKKVSGGVPSSRRAEDFLVGKGVLTESFRETIDAEADHASVARHLQDIYAPAKPEVVLANSGMSAIAATIEAVNEVRNQDRAAGQSGRDTWILLGNLYRDSEDLVMSRHAGKTRVIRDVTDVEGLKELVGDLDGQIAGVITEAPTNPLLDVPDLERVKDTLGDIPLIVDVSSAGSMVLNAMPHADVVVESLTKFASGHGDIMMGSIAINPDSPYAIELGGSLPKIVESPYERDVSRLAYELEGWPERTVRIGRNTIRLADFFEKHSRVKDVHWTGTGATNPAYAGLARDPEVPAGLITIGVKRAMRPAYDALDLSKGPSFGTQFTLNTDFVGIVYPQDLLDSFQRRMLERRTRLNDRMLRVSVGTEDPDWLIDRYKQALKPTER